MQHLLKEQERLTAHDQRFAYFVGIPVFVTQLLMLGLAIHHMVAERRRGQKGFVREEKGEELGFIMAPESLRSGAVSRNGGDDKGSPEMHVYSAP